MLMSTCRKRRDCFPVDGAAMPGDATISCCRSTPGTLLLQHRDCYTILSVFHSFLLGLNLAKWSSSIPLLCSFMKYESGSRVSCLVSPPPKLARLAPSLASTAVGLISVSPDREPNEFGSGQASSDWLAATADALALWSDSTWVYTHCKFRCLQRWQGVSPPHSETLRLHSRQAF